MKGKRHGDGLHDLLLHTHPDIDGGVGAVALQGVEGQLALEVAGVETGDGKAVAIAGLHTHAHTQSVKNTLLSRRNSLWLLNISITRPP